MRKLNRAASLALAKQLIEELKVRHPSNLVQADSDGRVLLSGIFDFPAAIRKVALGESLQGQKPDRACPSRLSEPSTKKR